MKTNGVSFAKNINTLFSCLSLTVACFMSASSAAYAAIAGHVQFVSGNVQIVNAAGQAHQAQKGGAINEGDTLTSAQKSSAQIKMQDGGLIAIRPDSQMKFDQFVFAGKEDGSEKSVFSVFKGGFRAITGAIGQVNKQNYRITTPTASIGIRGSDHETLVIIPGSTLSQLAPTGSYSKVNVGGTSMTTNEGTLNVGPNQMGFAGGLDQPPQLQPLNTNIFTVAPAPALTPVVNAGEAETGAAQEPGSATQEETPPIREVAVVDTTAPRTGGAPAANAPPVTTTTVAEVVEPPAPTTVVPTTTVAGLDVNLTTGTATTNTGQIIPITQSLAATQAQSAADAAALAATGAQTAANTAQTDNTQLTALLPVDTAPAATAIATADPLVTGAATSYSGVSTITPVATTSAATAVSTATTNVNAAATAVTTASTLTPVATTPAATAIGTAGTLIGTTTPLVTSANGLAPVATTSADTAIAIANTHIEMANTAVSSATALTPVNAATATANATAAQTAATAAANQTSTAATLNAANVTSGFADTTAAPALAAAQAANATLQPANTAVQGAVILVNTNNASLTATQLAAQNALTAATSNLAAANTSLNTATTQNTALTAAQLAAQSALTTAQANLVMANNNLTTATTQNTALTAAQLAAQSALTTAQTSLATANTNLTAATTQNAALTAAQLAAQNALTTAQANLVAASTSLNTATVQNHTIAAAQLAAPAQLTAAQTAAAAAQTAAAAAQTAATLAVTLQAAGDLVGAQAQLLIAQQQLAIAQAQQAAATAAQTTLTTSLTSAQTAQTTGLTNVNNAVAAATAAQTAASTVTTQAALVSQAAYTASTALAAVTPAASTAITDAGTASAQAAAAQTAVGEASTAVTTATTAANTAATNAGTASTQATAAQTAVSTATTAVSTATSAANIASTDAGIASTQASAAQTAATDAAAALSTSISNLATVNTNAPLVAANAPVAAYNNPAVVTPNRFVGVLSTIVTPATGQYIEGYGPGAGFAGAGTANTSFVLDATGNLVESRNTWYEETPASTATAQILVADANVKRTGGVAAEAFKFADNSIYGGRWTGGSLTVSDNTPASATYTPVPVFTRNLGASSEHWAIMLMPATGYVQALTGTTSYSMASATSPTDAQGNVGVLNSATLSANFTSQLVSAALNLGINAKTLDVQAPNMPINGFGFSTNNGVTATCTGCTGTYYANVGGGFAGDAAASAGLNYSLWTGQTPGSTAAATDLIQGLVAFNTIIPPTLQAFDLAAQAAATAAVNAAVGAQTSANAAQTTNTQLTALLPVDTAPAATAIATADPLVASAATSYSGVSTTTPVATTSAATAVSTATTNVGTATTAVTTANALTPVATTPAATAIGTASSLIGTATPVVTTAGALTPADATLAAANATAAATTAGSAHTQTTTAAGQLAANAAFADATAAPALAATQAANTTLQSANTAVQGAVTPVNTNNAALSAAQTAAQNALAAAQANLAAANTSLSTATSQNTALSTAQTNAQNALTAANNNLAAANTSLSTATNQNTALTTAQTAAQNALATAQANLAAANTSLNTATAQNNTIATAQTAAPAQLSAAQTAAAAAQTAAAAAQTAATQAATLQAAGDLAGAQAQLLIAQQQLAIAQTQQAAAANAQTALTASLTSAQTAQTTGQTSVSNAVAAANTAQTQANTASTQSALVQPAATAAGTAIAAVLPAANTAITDAGTASTQAATAQTALSAASTAATGATTAASTAANDATAAQTQAAAAQTASTNANAALATSSTSLATINSQAAIIASNAPIAAYNNPAVAANFIAATMFPVSTAGGFNEAFAPTNPLRPNTTYVLDGGGNLVEARNLPFQVQSNPNGAVLTPSITATSGADIKWSGGTSADTFKLADNSLYAGRWMGATVTVTDNAAPTNIYTYTPAASLWAVILPPAAGYVPSLVGTTTYNRAGNTTPVDANGNLGILNSASLTANFTSQLVDAAVNLTMNTGTMAGTYNVSAINMPIDVNGGFGVPNAGALTTNCTTGTCAAGATGYSADMGGSFAGTSASSAGMSYNIWPTTALSTDAAINSILGLVAFTGTTPATGTHPPAGSNYGIDFMNPVTIAGGYNTGLQNNVLPMANTSILLDGAGNLVKLFGTTYQEPGSSAYASPQLPPIVSLANANIAWSGGTAADYHQSTSGAVTFGRWQGGIVTVTDLSVTTPLAPITTSLAGGVYGPTSSLWAYATGPANDFVQSLTGTTSYTKTAQTTPFDSQGGLGVLNSATLSANFTSQLVSAALNLTMNTGLLAGDTFDIAGNMQINANSNSFKSASQPVLSCTGPCVLTTGESFLAEMSGAFVGATAVDAVLGYAVWLERPTSPADIVYGYVAFNTGVAPTVNPAGPLAAYVATNTAVAYNGSYGGSFSFIAAPGDVTPLGSPTTFTQNFSGGYRTDILNGATTTTPPTTTANGITFGVWENVTSVSSSDQMSIMPNQYASMRTLPSYMYGAEGYLDSAVIGGTNTGPLTGVVGYTPVASTSHDMDNWTNGTLTRTTMSANFTNQTLSLGLSGTMGAHNWTLDSTNVPITFMNTTTGTGARFNNNSPVITVDAAACGTNCGGNINGAFLGQNYAGALVQYSLWDNNNLSLGGLIGFENTAPVTPGAPTSPGTWVVANSWTVASPSAITTDLTTNVLTGWSGSGWNSAVAPAAGSVAYTGTGSGLINWGSWGSGSTNTNIFSYTPGFAQLHWITAPEPTPVYLSQVLTTTNAVYNFVDGDVTNMFSVSGGGHGTINGTTSLTANFTTQTVAANLNLTVGGNTWAASTSNAPLQYSSGNILNAFSADSYRSSSQPGYLTVTVNPGTGPIAAGGSLNGQLVGAALDGAILKFNLVGVPAASTEWVQGVAALGAAAANDPATSYRMVLTSISEPMALVPTVMLDGAYNNAARVLTDVNGLTQFDASLGGGSSTVQYVSGTYADQGSAVFGADTISWGRWAAGSVVNVQDRNTGVWQNNITLDGGAHAVVGPIATGPVSLPTSGAYTYNLIGNTSPTDQAGVAGTLNSATLSADFTAQTVNVGVNVTAGGATLNAAATSVPIMNRANFFTDSKMTGAGALAVTCTGSCGTTNHGGIGGGFGGAGGVGAAITYGFEKGGINAGTVNGVAVFQQGTAITAQ